MRAGHLNRRITIQRKVSEAQPSGQRKPEWVDYKTIWAQVKCTDSKAVDSTGAIQHESIYRFYIRRTSGITPEMRILYQDRIFYFTGAPVDWEDERTGLTLLAKELVKWQESE